MNKMEFKPTDRYKYDLLSTVQTLHMSTMGTSDPLPNQTEIVEWLKWRLFTWTPSKDPSEAYDNAVADLVFFVLAEYKLHLARFQKS